MAESVIFYVVAESVVILHGSLMVMAQSAEAYGVRIRFATSDLWWPKVYHFTWVPKRGGRKRRILHGSPGVVAQSAEAYGVLVKFATSDLWWLKV